MINAPEAIAIINSWADSKSAHNLSHKIAVKTLNEMLCHSEPNGMSLRCSWCEGGAAVFTIPIEGQENPDAMCIWCASDLNKKNLGGGDADEKLNK